MTSNKNFTQTNNAVRDNNVVGNSNYGVVGNSGTIGNVIGCNNQTINLHITIYASPQLSVSNIIGELISTYDISKDNILIEGK